MTLPAPYSLDDQFGYAAATGDVSGLPQPLTILQMYLYEIAINGAGGSSGMFLGYVSSSADPIPTTRPDGSDLEMEDYIKPTPTLPESAFPFTVTDGTNTLTFSSIRDKGIYDGAGGWMLEAGLLQDTSETPVKNKITESLSETATRQSTINQENKIAIKQRVKKFLNQSRTRDGWLADLDDEDIINGTGTITDVPPTGTASDELFVLAVKRNASLYWLVALGSNGVYRCTKQGGTWSAWELISGEGGLLDNDLGWTRSTVNSTSTRASYYIFINKHEMIISSDDFWYTQSASTQFNMGSISSYIPSGRKIQWKCKTGFSGVTGTIGGTVWCDTSGNLVAYSTTANPSYCNFQLVIPLVKV